MCMCLVGITQCPTCEREFETKTENGHTATLRCPKGHEWEVTDTHNISAFYPQLDI